jgi:hypothetical protein
MDTATLHRTGRHYVGNVVRCSVVCPRFHTKNVGHIRWLRAFGKEDCVHIQRGLFITFRLR